MQDAFLDVTLPVLGATLRALDAEHRQASAVLRLFLLMLAHCILLQCILPTCGLHCLQNHGNLNGPHACLCLQVVGEEDRKLQKRLKYLGERMRGRGPQEEGVCARPARCLHSSCLRQPPTACVRRFMSAARLYDLLRTGPPNVGFCSVPNPCSPFASSDSSSTQAACLWATKSTTAARSTSASWMRRRRPSWRPRAQFRARRARVSEPATVGDGRSFGVALAAQAVVFGRRERGWVGPLRCCSMRYLQLGTGVESEERGWVRLLLLVIGHLVWY